MQYKKQLAVTAIAVLVTVAVIVGHRAWRDRRLSRFHLCQNFMMQIEACKEQYAQGHKLNDGAMLTMEQILPIIKAEPVCPSGGRYTVGKLGKNARCSVHGEFGDYEY